MTRMEIAAPAKEHLELFDLSVVSTVLRECTDYYNPILKRHEGYRQPAVLFGVRKLFNTPHYKAIVEAERKSLVDELKHRIKELEDILLILTTNQTIQEAAEKRKLVFDNFDYIKLRPDDTRKVEEITQMLARSSGWLKYIDFEQKADKMGGRYPASVAQFELNKLEANLGGKVSQGINMAMNDYLQGRINWREEK